MERPGKCITVEEARELQKTWKETRGREIQRGQGYEDCCEFWYSVTELEEYIKYVKEKSEEQGINNPGLRIYLGAYPSQGRKKGLSTIFIAPTKDEAEIADDESQTYRLNNYSIDPMNDSQQGWPPTEY